MATYCKLFQKWVYSSRLMNSNGRIFKHFVLKLVFCTFSIRIIKYTYYQYVLSNDSMNYIIEQYHYVPLTTELKPVICK